ncbi:unnamed protein product, partial [Sphacelaria rigidula]
SPSYVADREVDTPSPVVVSANDGTSSPILVIGGEDNDNDQGGDEEEEAPAASVDDDTDTGDANRSGSEGFTNPDADPSAAVRVTTTAQFRVVMAGAAAVVAMAVQRQ